MLPVGSRVEQATAMSAGTAIVAPTSQRFRLIDEATGETLGETYDDTANAWPSNTTKTLAFPEHVGPFDEVRSIALEVYVDASVAPSVCLGGGIRYRP